MNSDRADRMRVKLGLKRSLATSDPFPRGHATPPQPPHNGHAPSPQLTPSVPPSPISPFELGGGSCSAAASDAPSHPSHLFLPPVDMRESAHLGYSYVDPEATSPGPIIRAALNDQVPDGMEARPVSSPHGTHLLIFRSMQRREFAVNESPFPVEHSVYFERHEEALNRRRFVHAGYVALALVAFPLEHWCRAHIQGSIGGMGNPMEVASICMSGSQFIAVLVVCKFENLGDIPTELEVKNLDGSMTLVEVRRMRQWPLFGAVLPPPPFGPSDGGHAGGGPGEPGGPRGGGLGGSGPRGPPGGPFVGSGGGDGPSSSRAPPMFRHLSGAFRSLPAVLHPHGRQTCREFELDVCPAATPAVLGAQAFSAVTAGGVPHPITMHLGCCPRYFHLLLRGDACEVGYFRVPRELASAGEPGPRGMLHINLDSGSIGIIDTITQVRGVASSISVLVVAEAVVCDDPLQFVPASCDISPVVPPCPPAADEAAAASPAQPACASKPDHGAHVRASSSTAPATPPPPFQPEELLGMARGCQLPEEDVRGLADAALMPEGAP